MDEKMLSTKEVAEYFGVTERTVTQKFVKEGLKFFPISAKNYRYNAKDILEFEEMKKNEVYEPRLAFSRQIIYRKMPSQKTNEMKVF